MRKAMAALAVLLVGSAGGLLVGLLTAECRGPLAPVPEASEIPSSILLESVKVAVERSLAEHPTANSWQVSVDSSRGLVKTNWFRAHKGEEKLMATVVVSRQGRRVEAWQRVGLLRRCVTKTERSESLEHWLESSLEAVASWPLACAFIPVEEATDQVAACANRNAAGEIRVRPSVAADHVAPGTVSQVAVDHVLLFFLSSGKTARAHSFDNGADYFVEGLARTVRDGMMGFVNENLDEVIPPQWDFASPFESGLAVVCNGCTLEPRGEHRAVVGGFWGYIDSKGEVIVPLVHRRDELPSAELLKEN